MTTVRKVSQRGLVTVAIMLALILAFYSLANAATNTVYIGCTPTETQNIANVINSDSKSIATRFVLGPCTYTVRAEMRLSAGDEIVGVPGSIAMRPVRGTYPVGIKSTLQAAPGVAVIAKPNGYFYSEWVRYTGADFQGSSGTGVGIAGGSMADNSVIKASLFDHNEGAGISSAHGAFTDVEAAFNGSSASAGFIAGGIKARSQVHISGGYFHSNIGNGVWCDSGCDPTGSPNGFYVHGAELSENTGAGARYENSTTGALIENNHVWGNSTEVNRAGITLRDAQNATVRNNIFAGSGFAHNQAPKNIAIRADSSGRIATKNISVIGNVLGGEKIKTCGGVVACSGNIP
jgi:hypothetical protein